MRLSGAGLRCRQTKLIYPDHRLPPWPNGDAAPRSLEPIVRQHPLCRAGDAQARAKRSQAIEAPQLRLAQTQK
jgi:hypothetical protein